MRKTYLSLSVSRAWSAEVPVGDPCGGPAYGERNMPLVAVVAAAASTYTLATVGIAAMSAFQVVAAVGAIASGIGAITGNEKLTKIGGVVSLVGGVGAFAQGKGWIAGDAPKSPTGTAASAQTQNAQAAKVAGEAGGNVAELAQGGADVSSQIDAASSAVQPSADGGSGLLGAQKFQTSGDLSRFDRMAEQAAASGAPAPVAGAAASAPKLDSTFDHIGGLKDHVDLPGVAAKSGGFMDSFKSIGKFMEENKTMMSLGGSAIGGMFDEEKKAREEYYKARAEGESAQTGILRQQQANMANMPYANVTQPRPSVFRPGAQTYTPVGLLNSRR